MNIQKKKLNFIITDSDVSTQYPKNSPKSALLYSRVGVSITSKSSKRQQALSKIDFNHSTDQEFLTTDSKTFTEGESNFWSKTDRSQITPKYIDFSKNNISQKKIYVNCNNFDPNLKDTEDFQISSLSSGLDHKNFASILSPLNTSTFEKNGNLIGSESSKTHTSTQRTTDLIKKYTKKYILAKRIVTAFEKTLENNNEEIMQKNLKIKTSEDDEEMNSFTLLQTRCQNLIELIHKAIKNRKDKVTLDNTFVLMGNLALKTQNIEIYISTLKVKGKIGLMYGDVYRAIGDFKTIKKIADQNKLYLIKLKAYKHLALCFQKIENYKMAILYNFKLLQTAWLCNNVKYELLAYDNIGILYYYEGDIPKAKFYHEKMMSGAIEPKNSKLRQLGITKLTNKMVENSLAKKNTKIKRIQEELYDYDIPLSEDDFELPSPRNQIFIQTHPIQANNPSDLKAKTSEKKNNVEKQRKNIVFQKTSRNDFRKRMNPFLKLNSTTNSEVKDDNLRFRKMKNDIFSGPLNPQILLSHMSPNRILNNFHSNDNHFILKAYTSRGLETRDNYIVLDSKSLEKVRKKLEKLIENIRGIFNSLKPN